MSRAKDSTQSPTTSNHSATKNAVPLAVSNTLNPAAGRSLSIRMYCHGLGDCFLVRFPKDTGDETFNVLIDCGVIGVAKEPKPLMERVVQDIAQTCNQHLDLVIVTHEHWDHVSGFSTQQAQAIFDGIKIDQVWYAWTEDPSPTNKLGRKLRQEREAKAQAVHRAALALNALQEPLAADRAQRVGSLLSFFGYSEAHNPSVSPLPAAGEGKTIGKTRAAFDYLAQRRGVKVRYCRPTDAPAILPNTGGIQAFILGPPEDEGLIKRSSPTKTGKEVYELDSELMLAEQIEFAFERLAGDSSNDEVNCPFDASYRHEKVDGPPLALKEVWETDDWRQIQYDWTTMAEALALNLDTHTNNTCLVIAFELQPSGGVLLFAADAQVGNWLSWQDTRWNVATEDGYRIVSGPDLLHRTLFYKVGHHGSHNATLREHGLEQMTSKDLVAFVPVNKKHAEMNRWHAMPFEPLIGRLKEKTYGRVVMSDLGEPLPSKETLSNLTEEERATFLRDFKREPTDKPLYVEMHFPF